MKSSDDDEHQEWIYKENELKEKALEDKNMESMKQAIYLEKKKGKDDYKAVFEDT